MTEYWRSSAGSEDGATHEPRREHRTAPRLRLRASKRRLSPSQALDTGTAELVCGTDGSTNWQEQRSGHECVNVCYTFLPLRCLGSPPLATGWGDTALHALIAEMRGTAAALAEAEQRVASATAELAQQDLGAQPAQQTRRPLQGVATPDGWPPAERPCPTAGIF